MDKKHIEYCIKLGNPYMKEENYQEQLKTEEIDFSWIPKTEMQNEEWTKNSKKFTN